MSVSPRILTSLALASLLALAGCPGTPTSTHLARATGHASSAPTAAPTATPTASTAPAASPSPTAPLPSPTPTGLARPTPAPLPWTATIDLAAAGIISDHGAGLIGKVKLPSGLISDVGGGLVSNNGGNVVSNNGGSVVSNNGGSLIGKTKRQLLATLDEQPVAGIRVYLLDAAGRLVVGPDGKPLVATTDAQGQYAFAGIAPGHNMLAAVDLGTAGIARAVIPKQAAAPTDVDLVSSLTTGYILDKYVAGQPDAVVTLDRLPADVEATTRAKASTAIAGASALPDSLVPTRVDATVESLRQHDLGLDAQLEVVRRLLVVGAASAAVTDGGALAAQLQRPSGLALDADGTLYVADTANNLIRVVKVVNGQRVVQTIAGSGHPDHVDGAGTQAAFNFPEGLALDGHGHLYVADAGNQCLRQIDLATPGYAVTTVAGSPTAGFTDGPGAAATFKRPRAVAADGSGHLYVADAGNGAIRAIDLADPGHAVTTLAGHPVTPQIGQPPPFADGPGASALFDGPAGLALDGQTLYIADTTNMRVRALDLADASHPVRTLAGTGAEGVADGPAATATFAAPAQLAIDRHAPNHPRLLVGQLDGTSVRAIDLVDATHPVSTPGGDAKTTQGPLAVVADDAGRLYIASTLGNQIALLDPADGTGAQIIAGSGTASFQNGTAGQARFNAAWALAAAADGTLFVADQDNDMVRQVTPAGDVTTLAGTGSEGETDGPADQATFHAPRGIAVDTDGTVYVMEVAGCKLRAIDRHDPAHPVVSTIAGVGFTGSHADGPGLSAGFMLAEGVCVDHVGHAYIAESLSQRIRMVDLQDPTHPVSTLAGTGLQGASDGPGLAATFAKPAAVAADAGKHLYIADYDNHCIRALDLVDPAHPVTTIAGGATAGHADGPGATATFMNPQGIAYDGHDPAHPRLYVADLTGGLVRMIDLADPAFGVTTLSAPGVASPAGVAVDGAGHVYVTDVSTDQIKQVAVP